MKNDNPFSKTNYNTYLGFSFEFEHVKQTALVFRNRSAKPFEIPFSSSKLQMISLNRREKNNKRVVIYHHTTIVCHHIHIT